MKEPTTARLLLGRNRIYPIDQIHFSTSLVTLKESSKVYNTVSISDVEFDFFDFSDNEIKIFMDSFHNA